IYNSLANAVAAVPKNTDIATTITMIADETFTDNATMTIEADQNIVLDLNGKIITGKNLNESTWAFLTNNGTLEITDTSMDKNGEITSSTTPETNNFAGHYTVLNKNVMKLTAGTIEETSDEVGGGQNLKWALRNEAGANQTVYLTINGGSVIGEYNALSNYVYNNTSVCNVTINGGSIITTGRFSPMTMQIASGSKPNANVTINGGKFIVQNIKNTNEDGNAIVYCDDQSSSVTDCSTLKFTVTNGKFNTYNTAMLVQFDDFTSATVKPNGYIIGGLFKIGPATNEIADGYECVNNTDEATKTAYPYVVKAKDPVAKIDKNTYASLTDAIAAANNNDTITLLEDITLTKELTIAADKKFTLDLNGKTIKNAETDFEFTTTETALANGVPVRFMIVNYGEVTICDNSQDANGKISAGSYNYGTTKAILVYGNGKLTVNSGEIHGDYAAIYVIGNTALADCQTNQMLPELTVNGGTITGSYGVSAKGATAQIIVNEGATITASGKAAILSNGTTDWYDGGHNKIIINGGNISSTGNEGMAFYNPAENTVEIKGGTLTAATAVAIKGGNVTISGGAKLIATGTKKDPQATSSGAECTGDALYIEDTYSDHKPVVTVTGGFFKSTNGFAVQYYTNKANENVNKGSVSLSGGYYSEKTNVPELVANGYVCVSNTDETTKTEYPYIVKPAEVIIEPAVVGEDNIITVGGETIDVEGAGTGEGQPTTQQAAEAITKTLNNPEVTGFTETKIEEATPATVKVEEKVDGFDLSMVLNAVKEAASEKFKNGSATASKDDEITIKTTSDGEGEKFVDTDVTKQITVDLTAATVTQTGTEENKTTVTEMTFEVKPIANITVTDEEGKSVTVIAVIPNEAITAPITFRLPVDSK
ncbi:MAG: hypothetical protein Q4F34_08700, partial [Prevotellaceae bacterium]|nr:hypothetical protein [Prevotellaceae bacterium]